MKIFRCDQIREIDEYTIRNEPVASIDLMERAAGKLFKWYTGKFDTSRPVTVFAGPGNNGGDGLALARMLLQAHYKTEVYFSGSSSNCSPDWLLNRKRLEEETDVSFLDLEDISRFPLLPKNGIIIDAIFGSGLSRPVIGIASDVIRKINTSGRTVISIDIPSGLFGEDNSVNNPENIIRADYTLTFQFPKLSFMFPENEKFTGDWQVLPIGLHEGIIGKTETPYFVLGMEMIKPMLRQREKFAHKGNFGHGLLIGGSYGKMGAVILGARAALHTGIGLVSCHIPSGGNLVMQCAVPEAMAVYDKCEKLICEIGDTSSFSAVGIGPGMGTDASTRKAVFEMLQKCRKNLVIDADALNILSQDKDQYRNIPPMAVLTPHPGEFERLAGKSTNGFERLMKQIEFSKSYNCVVVLKGAHTSISEPGGNVWFNSTGNPGMATAGSGDTLTGMILSLLAQGYKPVDAAITGVYIHGLAGDIAAGKTSSESLIASGIIESIGDAFNRIRE